MIAVIGLGPVGHETAAFLHERHHEVVGVDIVEARRQQRLYPTKACSRCVMSKADVIVLCVHDKDLETIAVDVQAVKKPEAWIVVRSTTKPGTINRLFGPEAFYVPEFRREAMLHFPPRYGMVGSSSPLDAIVLERMFFWSNTPVLHGTVENVEKAKLAVNAWHSLQIAFVNELERIMGENATDLARDAFSREPQGEYMFPGSAYGGKCLPKDMRHLIEWAGEKAMILAAIEMSNDVHAST